MEFLTYGILMTQVSDSEYNWADISLGLYLI